MADAGERRANLSRLKALDTTALVLVFDALGDDDPSVRREAVRAVTGGTASSAVLEMLERALTDVDVLARRSSAMDAVAALGPSAVPMLQRLADDERVAVRRIAVDTLGMLKVPEAFAVLERACRDPQPAIRSAALEGVARTGASSAGALLGRVLEDPREQPSVLLAALLGLLPLSHTPPPAVLKRLAAEPLTAPPALRLLGRCGEVSFLLDAVTAHTGSRQRAAVLGLADALDAGARPTGGVAPSVTTALRHLLDSPDVHVAAAALLTASHLGDVDVFVQAAARDDRAHLASAAHKAAGVLARAKPDLASTLRVFAADDAPGANLLRELADAVDRARARPAAGIARLDEAVFARLCILFEQAAGLAVTSDARTRVEARLVPRVEALGRSFADYADLLERREGAEELQTALERITVHETYFFRERSQLDAFHGELVPALSTTLLPNEPVRVWSAGTATGEEAWTLAMVLQEAGVRFEVMGTDLSREAVATATAARYTPRSFRGDIEAAIRRRWFIYELGGVSIHHELRRHVRFQAVNLVDDAATAGMPQFDAIFCRNVLIYASARARARIIEMFWRKLKPGGLLLLGHSESLVHIDTPFKVKPLKRGLAYEKVVAGSAR